MGFISQLSGFIKRNSLLKYRNKFQFISEIVFPITMLIFLVMGKFVFSPEHKNEEFFLAEEFPPLNNTQLIHLYVFPKTNKTIRIGKLLQNSSRLTITDIDYCNNYDHMRRTYIRDVKDQPRLIKYFGLEFPDPTNPFEYTIYEKWSTSLFFKDNVVLFGSSHECSKYSTDILNIYSECAGNKYVYNGLSSLKYYTDLAIKSVNYFYIIL